ncbi:MAG: hypothetical protein C4541_09320 [Candidatus Auribacter fodinae]|jgi:hydroxymethylpyrimidine pyrophosphatase-like HAD family hydrolase|uniref:HAD-IIB family hydrolase n=1 Tax=Candidatus Auribacter fodinae TaxID=2093366 RepID=A0A3A4R6L4_9BACT|nr:MAG: hypothetical protein C4541_09320 [Candidatus Auribacter fodinae]
MINAWHKKFRHLFNPVAAIAVTGLILSTYVSSVYSLPETLTKELRANPKTGTIVESFTGLDDREIMIIMDAHCNAQAQQHIADILSLYVSDPQKKIIAMEGAAGELGISDLRTFPLEKTRSAVSLYFLKEGKINGVEYFNIIARPNENQPITIGVENAELYIKNLTLYRSFNESAVQAQDYIAQLKKFTYNMAESSYGFQQKQFDAMSQAVQRSEVSFVQYCMYLVDLMTEYGAGLNEYPAISMLHRSLEIEKQIDSFRLEFERDKAVALLAAEKETESYLSGMYNDLQINKITPFDYYTRLFELAREKNVDLSSFKQLHIYSEYLKTSKGVDHAQLIAESASAHDQLAKLIFSDPGQYAVYQWSSRFAVMAKLFSLDLSASEYKRLLEEKDLYLPESIGAFLAQYNAPSELTAGLPEISGELENSLLFYETAHQRNRTMIDNLLSDMEIENCEKACLVVGGFHVEGIKEILAEELISYTIVSPGMTDHNHYQLYRDRLNNTRSPFEQALENAITQFSSQSRSTLAVASLLARHALLDSKGAKSFRIELKAVLTAAGIKELESQGLYNLSDLKDRIESFILAKWGSSNFQEMRYINLFRGLSGELILEMEIVGKKYTFSFKPESEAERQFFPDDASRILTDINLDGITVVVREGSYIEHEAAHSVTLSALTRLMENPLPMDDLNKLFLANADVRDALVQKWLDAQIVQINQTDTGKFIELTQSGREFVETAQTLISRGITAPDTSLPQSITNTLKTQNITEIIIDQSAPLPVVIDFLIGMMQADADQWTGTNPVIFALSGESSLYQAQVSSIPGSDTRRLEFIVTRHADKPYDTETRDANISSIYNNPAVLADLFRVSEERKFIPTSPAPESTKALLSGRTAKQQAVLDKLLAFIGDPETFNDRPKAIVFDLDGTLSIREGDAFLPIPDEIIDVMGKLMDRGIHIVIISGQVYDGIKERVVSRFAPEQLSRLHVYANNGSLAKGFDETGAEKPYYEITIQDVFQNTQNYDSFVESVKQIVAEQDVDKYILRVNHGLITVRLPGETYPDSVRRQIYHNIIDLMQKNGIPLQAAIAGNYSIDISANDKGDAINDFITNRLAVSEDDILVFGDSYDGNDESMALAALRATHFQVGKVSSPELLPDNVFLAEPTGPDSTRDILNTLDKMIGIVVDGQYDQPSAQVAATVLKNMEAYYDFHRRFSRETPVSELPEKKILPIWYATNEPQWEQVIGQLRSEAYHNTYVGVAASGVNLSYIAAAEPEQAVILDFNPVITQFFIPLRSMLVTFAPTRIDYLSLLSARPVRRVVRDGNVFFQRYAREGETPMEISSDATLPEIYAFFRDIKPSPKYLENVSQMLGKFFPDHIRPYVGELWEYEVMRNKGFDMMNMLEQLIKADQRAKQSLTWLSNEDLFQKTRAFITEGRLLAAETNWAGEEIADVASYLSSQGKDVDLIYLSNVMDKVAAFGSKEGAPDMVTNYLSNIASMPKSDNTLVLSDPSLQKHLIKSVEAYTKSNYEDMLESRTAERFTNKPFTPRTDNDFIAVQVRGYTDVIENILTQNRRPELSSFYADADSTTHSAILHDIADQTISYWKNIQQNIRSHETMSADKRQHAIELQELFGYALKDLDSVLNAFHKPEDFLMQLLLMPYDAGRAYLPAVITDLKARIVSSVDVFSKDPDIILVDSSLVTRDVDTGNFALGTTLGEFRREHRNRHNRRAIVIAVNTESGDRLALRKHLDASLFTRGDTSNSFDDILALGFDERSTSDGILYQYATGAHNQRYVDLQIQERFRQEGITSPSDAQFAAMREDVIAEIFLQQKLQNILHRDTGIPFDSLQDRVYIVTDKTDSALAGYARQNGNAVRVIEKSATESDGNISTGLFLIDILNSLGSEQLPAEMLVVSINDRIVITPEYNYLDYQSILSLFQSIYTQYAIMAQTAPPTYKQLIDAVGQLRTTGQFSATEENLLLPQDEMNAKFSAFLNTPIAQNELSAVVLRMLKPIFDIREKRVVQSLFKQHIAVTTAQDVIRQMKTDPETPLSLGDFTAQLNNRGIDIADIAPFLEVNMPVRPVSNTLNKAINHQRALDTSA